MILKASQRGFGQELARHLMRLDENDHVTLHELRGFSSDTLDGAFKEAEAVSLGTKCRQYLFSLSLNPPEQAQVSNAVFEEAVARAEERLGLTGQPRAMVFHEKNGRRHAHCVWSRIDTQTMTAKQLPFFKDRLQSLSRELHLEQGWQMPHGLIRGGARNPTNFTLAEWQQAKRQGVDPRWIKQAVQDCWARSDGAGAFANSLEEHGFLLGKGDRRGFVVMDYTGEVYALSRLTGVKSKELRTRLGDGAALRGVGQLKAELGQRMTPALRRHIEDSQGQHKKQAEALNAARTEMARRQRLERANLLARQKSEWDSETRERAERMPRGWRAVWSWISGAYQKTREENEREAWITQQRHASQQADMVEGQLHERAGLQKQIKALRAQQASTLRSLRQEIGRYVTMTRTFAVPDQSLKAGGGLKLQRSLEP